MEQTIDLTLPLSSSLAGADIRPAKSLARDGWNASTLELYSHCGTHMDAPVHFGVGDQTIDQIPLDRCMGPAWVADLSDIQPREEISVSHLGELAGQLGPGSRLLLRTDWYRRLGRPEYRDALPRLSEPFAHWLVERQVGLIGVEPPSVADVNNREELSRIHTILFKGDVIIVEGLAHLDAVTRPLIQFVALPLKVHGGDGCPVRALAIQEN